MHQRSCLLLSVLTILATSAQAGAQDQSLGSEMKFGPIQIVHAVAGTSVKTPATLYLAFEEAGEGYRMRGRGFIDLSALQRAAALILSGVSLPTDDCARYAPDNLVVSLRDPQISVESGQLRLRVDGDATVWQCIENIVPEIKIEWKMRRVGAVKINVPVRVETRSSKPIKNHLPTQPFVVTISFEPYVSVGDRVALRKQPTSVELTGNQARLIEMLLGAFDVNLSQKAEGILSKALPPTAVEMLLPEVARRFQSKIVKARLIDDGKPKLEVHIEGEGSGAQLDEAMTALLPPTAPPDHAVANVQPPTPSSSAAKDPDASCPVLTRTAEIPNGHHPERVIWRPESPDSDLVCVAPTTGASLRFVAWKGLAIPGGYAAVRQDASLDPQQRGCRTQAEGAPAQCSASWAAYELTRLPDAAGDHDAVGAKTHPGP